MRKVLAALYSTVVYVIFLAVFLYAIGFIESVLVPKTIDSGPRSTAGRSLLIDAGLLALFAVQHSVMARPAFKRAWTRIVPHEIERSTYVLFATSALALLCWQWQPQPQPLWAIADPVAADVTFAVSWIGWGLLLVSTFLISHFHLFGLTQGYARLLGRNQPSEPVFATPSLYRWLRHPIYAGFILAFWAAPRMSVGHFFFAAAATAYIFVGIWFEERDLIAQFGDRYRQYRASVGMLLPRMARRSHASPGDERVT
jgi:protein-S-isoprenylcysteine O-methyltransferase Ste14